MYLAKYMKPDTTHYQKILCASAGTTRRPTSQKIRCTSAGTTRRSSNQKIRRYIPAAASILLAMLLGSVPVVHSAADPHAGSAEPFTWPLGDNLTGLVLSFLNLYEIQGLSDQITDAENDEDLDRAIFMSLQPIDYSPSDQPDLDPLMKVLTDVERTAKLRPNFCKAGVTVSGAGDARFNGFYEEQPLSKIPPYYLRGELYYPALDFLGQAAWIEETVEGSSWYLKDDGSDHFIQAFKGYFPRFVPLWQIMRGDGVPAPGLDSATRTTYYNLNTRVQEPHSPPPRQRWRVKSLNAAERLFTERSELERQGNPPRQ